MGECLLGHLDTVGGRQLPGLGGDDMDRGAMLGQPSAGTQDLDLLDAVGAQDRDALALEEARIARRIEQEMVELSVELAIGGGERDGREQWHAGRALIVERPLGAGIGGRQGSCGLVHDDLPLAFGVDFWIFGVDVLAGAAASQCRRIVAMLSE